ncbi:PREDICTED: interferon alpha/beta receptor 2 [Chrysochloris asiatica]|uniref:Interferon alpha/beta receptor 2 n=1 Tax=Chrysochloris asiatica TaxID=185453 RepID=A0A9B0TF23_CHRAS|nr:PREDICTED: interferon alpha/beta receptor 2 [Chrysochloris asiatica]
MVFSQNASAIRLLNLYPWDFSNEPCILKMTLRNFHLFLSWKLKNHSIVPTHYTLEYTIMSKEDDMQTVKNCVNITRLFCNLTDVWDNMEESYLTRVMGFRGNTELIHCKMGFFPLMNTLSFEPPDFEIFGFMDHINVIVKFPSYTPKIINVHYFSLIIEQQSGKIVKKHIPQINGNLTGNFSYVIDKLIPNINHCVSVYFELKASEEIIKSPLKCIRLPTQVSESSEPAKIGGVTAVFLIAAVFISSLVLMKRIGCICSRNHFPKALNFHNWPAWIFPEPPPLEAVDAVEVIYIKRKKKEWNYSYEESDSEEETATRTSAGGYTRRGLIGKALTQISTSSTSEVLQLTEPDADELDLPEAEAEPLLVPGPCPQQSEYSSRPYERKESLLQDPFSEENNSSPERSKGRGIFNVNLNTVFVRVLDNVTDIPPMLPSPPEETVDLVDPSEMEPSFPVPREEGTLPASTEDMWSEDTVSEESDASESDADVGDGYIVR